MRRPHAAAAVAVGLVMSGVAAASPPSRPQIAAAAVEARRHGDVTLSKAELRAPMHQLVPLLRPCYERALAADPNADGVVNTRFVVESVAGQGTIFTVRGFDGTGPLAASRELRACVKATAEAVVLPPIANGGTADITYPITFAPAPPDNRDAALLDDANAAAAAGKWDDAARGAERGLTHTSLDGTVRRKLIGIGGVAACHLRDGEKARRYYALASATVEPDIREACARARIDVTH